MQGLSFIAGGRGGRFGAPFHAVNPATGERLDPAYHEVSVAELDRACAAAGQAFEIYQHASDAARAQFLRAIAERLESHGEIVARGQADLVGMTRAHIADPHVVAKLRAGRAADVRRCIG